MIKNNMILPYQELKNARKEIKELLQSVGFKVHHCSLRDWCYSDGKPQHRQFLNSIISISQFFENMPHGLMEECKNVITYEYMRRKIDYKSIHNDQEFLLDISKILVVYAQKIVTNI
ncbi:PREDICTED: uncharacterized protein LOC105460144 [Wasmannia auropunctata]|uniref:uncharacterized protein LOC105460144 n=1 Tax=Wasmannia auropunctata TaxID=64793 RepID=UPI0005EDDD0B|nr:PREDICTED: uncharacterized protein LOC105460144 [Wasmannia auropunctata]